MKYKEQAQPTALLAKHAASEEFDESTYNSSHPTRALTNAQGTAVSKFTNLTRSTTFIRSMSFFTTVKLGDLVIITHYGKNM